MSSSPANTSVYESTIHCSWLLVASSSRTIVGIATLRIELSSTMTSRLKHRTMRIQPPPLFGLLRHAIPVHHRTLRGTTIGRKRDVRRSASTRRRWPPAGASIAARRRRRHRQAHVGRGDPPLRVQHALEHRRVRLGEAAATTGSSASWCARPSSTLPASPHSIIATKRSVQTCAVAPMIARAPPIRTIGKKYGSSPPRTAKSSGAPASTAIVSGSTGRWPASPRRCSGCARARGAHRPRGGDRCASGCCRRRSAAG